MTDNNHAHTGVKELVLGAAMTLLILGLIGLLLFGVSQCENGMRTRVMERYRIANQPGACMPIYVSTANDAVWDDRKIFRLRCSSEENLRIAIENLRARIRKDKKSEYCPSPRVENTVVAKIITPASEDQQYLIIVEKTGC